MFNYTAKVSVTTSVDLHSYDVAFVSGTSAITITLPEPASIPVGTLKRIKKTGASGTITVQSAGGATIDGAASYALSTQWKYVNLISDGVNWFVFAAN